MAMRHLGCRIGFDPIGYNVFSSIEITTDWEDYKRADNADTNENDNAETEAGKTEDKAKEEAALVKAAYEKMCWPAGVSLDDMSLLMCAKDNDATTFKYKGKTTADIASEIRRPEFKATANDEYYLITIPYDMSSDGNSGEPIVLPTCTRFKIYLRDVNNGDRQPGTNGKESNYHIFSLADVLKSDADVQAFPDGLKLTPGHSFKFHVGYYYDQLVVRAADSFSWSEQDAQSSSATDEKVTPPVATTYQWWKDAIDATCDDIKQNSDASYNPVFEISTADELLELINLVNGNFNRTMAWHNDELNRDEKLTKYVEYIYGDPLNPKEVTGRNIRWYTYVSEPDDEGQRDYNWVTREELEAQGYLFYQSYTPSIGTEDAIFEEEVLDHPFSFYDENLGRRWTIKLKNDIDLKDVMFKNAIGQSGSTPFAGNFNGQGYCLSNVYMQGGSLFGYAKDGTISNLCVESTHSISLTITCENERLLGCSIVAPSKVPALASTASGVCYFVGCIHEGDTYRQPLVNDGNEFYMYGCMQAGYSATAGGAALANISRKDIALGESFIFTYREDTAVDSVYWDNVSCNYYDTEKWPNAVAFTREDGSVLPTPKREYTVGPEETLESLARRFDVSEAAIKDANPSIKTDVEAGKKIVIPAKPFHRLQYIRGAGTHVLSARNDFLIDTKTEWMKLPEIQKIEFYGVAPWRAMNFGIWRYNLTATTVNQCQMHYESDPTGYVHRYPKLKTGVPQTGQYLDVLMQLN